MTAAKDVRLSAAIVTKDEERNIGRCLDSLKFVDEIVVVDAMSKDRTTEIASAHGARVIPQKWEGFAPQKQFAVDEARGEWVLLIDADEEVTPELAEEIRRVVAGSWRAGDYPTNEPPSGYRIRRRNFFLGEQVRYGPWASDFQVRLFRKERGCIARRPVHEGVQVEGVLQTLKGPLNHYTHQTLSESFSRLNRYTSLEAGDRAGRRRIHVFDALVPPFFVFLRYYLGGCYRSGLRGFLLAATTAMYRSVLYLKILLLQRNIDAQSSP